MKKISIIIKALNEEKNIKIAIESSLQAISSIPGGGEVILADSLSTDSTISIAQHYPIRIVQLLNASDRSCGIAAQLGYEYSEGEFVYILDGDMHLSKEFLREAIQLMQNNPKIAGVGGQLQEMNMVSLEFSARVERGAKDMKAGEVSHLTGGGLYRRKAIEQLGYLTNCNLHAYEEFELGVRLRVAGWLLVRLPLISVKHYGYTLPEYQLLRRRWSSGYVRGLGELVRSAIGKNYFLSVVTELRELWLYALVAIWWIVLIGLIILTDSFIKFSLFLVVLFLPFILMVYKRKSFRKAFYAVVAWQYFTAGLIVGLGVKLESNFVGNNRSKVINNNLRSCPR